MRIDRKKGVTLIELIITIVMVSFLFLGISWYFQRTIEIWNFLSLRNDIGNQLRLGIMRMGRDIRQIRTRDVEEEPIEVATSVLFQFIKFTPDDEIRVAYLYDSSRGIIFYEEDTNSDGDFDDYREKQILLRDVDDFHFTYLDRKGNPTEEILDIYMVRIYLKVKKQEEELSISYEVFPRNLKY
ncbi:MAG: hypothetical protein DRP81_03840 [Candidatus Omnitrophota bacterium]|nr:MAG: hypothetical protein DRP81_03840 [Candidatus Omnitrophota bacterium]